MAVGFLEGGRTAYATVCAWEKATRRSFRERTEARHPMSEKFRRMLFPEMLTQVCRQLAEEQRLRDAVNASTESCGMWMRGTEEAAIAPSTSTGVLLRLASRGRTIHEKIFAASEVSVSRIARAITEHLTGYTAS